MDELIKVVCMATGHKKPSNFLHFGVRQSAEIHQELPAPNDNPELIPIKMSSDWTMHLF